MPKLAWKPTVKQAKFLSCPAYEVLYGGAPGGGKSDALLIDPLQELENEGFKALLLRRKYIDLERSLILRSHELYRGRGVYDGQNRRWRFGRNCFIEFGHCQRPNDIFNYQSAEYQYIGVEQVEQFLEDMYLFFFTRIRTTNPKIKCKVRSNANPGGVGHQWIKKRFWIHEREAGKAYEVKERMKHPHGSEEEFKYYRAFIPATVYDNPHILNNDRQYLMRLLSLPEPRRTAYLSARWDLFEGQFFMEWDYETHVCEPFQAPSSWRRWISFDWGYRDPACVLWFTESPDGTIYCYKELYVNETIDTDLALEMSEMSKGENIYSIFYPWDIDNRNSTGVSIRERMEDQWRKQGLNFFMEEGNKSRVSGWQAVRYFLSLKANGHPRMKVFSSCKNLIRTIPMQVFDETNSEDLDTNGDDHCVDSARYFLATFRTLDNHAENEVKRQAPIDVGGAVRLKDGSYCFKKEEQPSFKWMVE